MIIGLDIGVSSTKAVAFNLEGNVLATYSISYFKSHKTIILIIFDQQM